MPNAVTDVSQQLELRMDRRAYQESSPLAFATVIGRTKEV